MRIVASHLAPAPRGCSGPAPTEHRAFKRLGPLVGSDPAWAGVYANYDEVTNAYHMAGQPRRRSEGWAVKVLWVMPDTATDRVTLSAQNSSTGQLVLFDVGGRYTVGATAQPILDPARPAIPPQDGRLKEFPSNLFFPSAGCYSLSVAAADDSWALGFGFCT